MINSFSLTFKMTREKTLKTHFKRHHFTSPNVLDMRVLALYTLVCIFLAVPWVSLQLNVWLWYFLIIVTCFSTLAWSALGLSQSTIQRPVAPTPPPLSSTQTSRGGPTHISVVVSIAKQIDLQNIVFKSHHKWSLKCTAFNIKLSSFYYKISHTTQPWCI